MRIGLYGLPTSGKTYIMERVGFFESVFGSKLLREYDPDFDQRSTSEQSADRKAIAKLLAEKDNIIVDGHYAFGDKSVFTEDDGHVYDVIIYLYINPVLLYDRMLNSEKNRKYLIYDISKWQKAEIDGLRDYCHKNNKDFYIIDNPPEFDSENIETIISFLSEIKAGYSCVSFAKQCAESILTQCTTDTITLLDGDKTLTVEDSSNRVFGYKTHIYDGNFYTGYQAWKQMHEFASYDVPDLQSMPVSINETVLSAVHCDCFILTSGHEKVWRFISDTLKIPFFCGYQMSAETKYYITKLLQEEGKKVFAYGDGMNDYYMMKQADKGYLVRKADGTVSRSLVGKDLEGLNYV